MSRIIFNTFHLVKRDHHENKYPNTNLTAMHVLIIMAAICIVITVFCKFFRWTWNHFSSPPGPPNQAAGPRNNDDDLYAPAPAGAAAAAALGNAQGIELGQIPVNTGPNNGETLPTANVPVAQSEPVYLGTGTTVGHDYQQQTAPIELEHQPMPTPNVETGSANVYMSNSPPSDKEPIGFSDTMPFNADPLYFPNFDCSNVSESVEGPEVNIVNLQEETHSQRAPQPRRFMY